MNDFLLLNLLSGAISEVNKISQTNNFCETLKNCKNAEKVLELLKGI